MPIRVYYEVLNQKGSPAIYTDTYVNRPTYGYQGRLFISTDTGQIFEDTGTSWTLVADAGVGGGTLSSVCVNGNSTNTGIVVNGITFDDGAGTGTNNVSIGTGMPSNTTGLSNTSLGNSALGSNTIGSYSTAIGQGSLQALTTGGLNTAVGQGALLNVIAGSYNTALGQGALTLATGSANTSIGQGAGGTITTGANNICIGYQSGNGLTIGTNNVIIGAVNITTPNVSNYIYLSDGSGNCRLFSNSSGLIAINQAITNTPSAQLDIHSAQTYAQILNGTGTSNAYLGFSNAGSIKWRFGNNYNGAANTLDLYNVATSATALSFNATTNIPTFSGGNLIVTGTSTSAYGLQINNSLGNPGFVAYQNTDSSYSLQIASAGATIVNITSGAGSSYINSSANFGLGTNSPSYRLDVRGTLGVNNTFTFTGDNIILNGTNTSLVFQNAGVTKAYEAIVTSGANAYIPGSAVNDIIYRTNGSNFLWSTDSGGSLSMKLDTAGDLYLTAGTGNQLLSVKGQAGNGYYGEVRMGNADHSAGVVGRHVSGGQANLEFWTEYYSSGGYQKRMTLDYRGYLFCPGVYSVATGDAANVVVDSAGQIYRSTSSLKYKKDVLDYDKGLNEVMQMRPVYFKGISEKDGNKQYAGLIAEELHQIGLTEFVQYAEDNTPDAISYSNMIAILTKAIQELNQKIENLN